MENEFLLADAREPQLLELRLMLRGPLMTNLAALWRVAAELIPSNLVFIRILTHYEAIASPLAYKL